MKFKKIYNVTIAIIFMFCIGYIYLYIGNNKSNEITKDKILSIALGIQKDDVIKLLGKPVKIEGECSYGCTLDYAGLVLSMNGFEFYINIYNNVLTGIVINRYENGGYMCMNDYCPGVINDKYIDELCILSR